MKKQLCVMAAACGLLSLASCSDDENVIIDQPVAESDAQEIVLQIANAGDGLTTRGGRPLSSSDAAQDIDEVKIVIVNENDNKIVAVHTITNWMNVSSQYTTDGHGQQYSWKLSKDEMLQAGQKYRAYAVGYTNPNSSYSLTLNCTSTTNFITGIDETTPGDGTATLDWVNATMSSLSSEGIGGLGEEIFAGEIDITTNTDGEFEGDNILTLHRQVTGTIGYFTNIPTYKSGKKTTILGQLTADGTAYESDMEPKVANDDYQAYVKGLKLQLIVADMNDMVKMSGFNSSFTETGEDVQFIMNGAKSTNWPSAVKKAHFVDVNDPTKLVAIGTTDDEKGYVAYEITLGDWFKNGDISDEDFQGFLGNGFLNEDDAEGNNWVSPLGFDGEYKRGTVFAGQFMMPILKNPEMPRTMQLQLVATVALNDTKSNPVATEGEVIRAWNINLPEDDDQVWADPENHEKGNRHIETVNAEGEAFPVVGNEYEELTHSYSLVRNHLYTVGAISEDANEPEDLSKGNALILRVNDNWEMIHKMEIE